MRSRFATALLGLCVATALGGCDTVSSLRPASSRTEVPLARALDQQIAELDRLATATYQERIDLFREIELDYVDDPSDANRLRLALAKGVEGHPASDAESALTDLATLMGRSNTLSPTQMRLARMASRDIEERMIRAAEMTELQTRVDTIEQRSSRSSRADRRLQTARNRVRELEEENLRLSEELEQARRQLDAIMSIETSSDPTGDP